MCPQCSLKVAFLYGRDIFRISCLCECFQGIFERFDRDRSGSIDKGEMREALLSLGYSVSPPILDCLLQKYDRTGQAKAMDYDSFAQYVLNVIYLDLSGTARFTSFLIIWMWFYLQEWIDCEGIMMAFDKNNYVHVLIND